MAVGDGLRVKEIRDPGVDRKTRSMFVLGDVLYWAHNYNFITYDISDPSNPVELDRYNISNASMVGVRVLSDGSYAFVGDGSDNTDGGFGDRLRVFDVSDTSNISLVATLTDGTDMYGAHGMALSPDENHLYVTCYRGNTFTSVDISDPTNPFIADSIAMNYAHDVEVKSDGNSAFVSTHETMFYSVDISDPTNMSIVDSIDYTYAGHTEVNGAGARLDPTENYFFMSVSQVTGEGHKSFVSIDVSDPTNCTEADSFLTSELPRPYRIRYDTNTDYIYCATNDDSNYGGAVSIDVSDPTNMSIAHEYLDDYLGFNEIALDDTGQYVYAGTANSHGEDTLNPNHLYIFDTDPLVLSDMNIKKKLNITTDAWSTTGMSDFPALIHIEDGDDTTTGTGTVKVDWADFEETDGKDFRVFDSDETTLLDYEIEKWDDTNKEAWIWVKIPTMDRDGSDYIWIGYGAAGETDAQNITGVWGSNYKMVLHFDEASGTVIDSTDNNHDSTGEGPGLTREQSAIIGDGYDFDTAWIDFSTISEIGIGKTFTIVGIAQIDVLDGSVQVIFSDTKDLSNRGGIGIKSDKFGCAWYDGSSWTGVKSWDTPSTGSYFQFVYIYNNGTGTLYINNTEKTGIQNPTSGSISKLTIGDRTNHDRPFDGKIDDIQVYDGLFTTAQVEAYYDMTSLNSYELFNQDASESTTTLGSIIFTTGGVIQTSNGVIQTTS